MTMNHSLGKVVRAVLFGGFLWGAGASIGRADGPAFQFYGTAIDPNRYSDYQARCDQIIASGVKWVRINVEWGFTETARGVYSAGELAVADAIVNQLTSAGVNIVWVLGFTPQWASSQPSSPNFRAYAPSDWQDWKDYVSFMGNRYSGKVFYWEIWNEEDSGFWADTVANYETLLAAASVQLRALNPSNKILLGGLATSRPAGDYYGPGTFLDTLLADGAAPYFDFTAYHAYGNSLRQFNAYNGMMSVLNKYGLGSRPIWITETGYTTNGDDSLEPTKGEFSDESYLMYSQWSNIERIFWYCFQATDVGEASEDNYGLIDADLNPLPAFYHYQAANGAETDFGLQNDYPTLAPTLHSLCYFPAASGDGSYVTDYNGDPALKQIPSGRYMYFRVADDWLFGANSGLDSHVTVSVTYLDQGSATWWLHYDGASAAYAGVSKACTNTGQWLTASFSLSDALFSNRQNNATDLRLYAPPGTTLIVRSVEIRKEPLTARIILGTADVAKYIARVLDDVATDEAYNPPATQGGLSCREILGNTHYAYFKVTKALVKPTTTHVNVTITYWDSGTDRLCLQYNSVAGGAYKSAVVAKTNTLQWKQATLSLADAAFNQMENYGGDFRIGNNGDGSQEWIREVDVSLP